MQLILDNPMLAVYLWSVIGKLEIVFMILLALSITATILAAIALLSGASKTEKSIAKKVFIITAILVTLGVVTPSKETVAYAVGASLAAQAVKSETAELAIQLLQEEIKDVLLKKDKKSSSH